MDRRTRNRRRSDQRAAVSTAGPSAAREQEHRPASQIVHPIELVDVGEIPGGGQLHLLKCGEEFSIEFNRDELMGSEDHVSEQALATLTCARLASNDGHVLVGGLGMGFTLGAVLAAWAPTSSVIVAELVPQIITWAKGPLAHLFSGHLSDPRVSIRLADVHDIIGEGPERFDAILLDVDNGPEGFITTGNDRLYTRPGLSAAYAALRPKGVLAVWSAFPDNKFFDRLEDVGFAVEEIRVPAYVGSRDRWHSLWFAAKPDSDARQEGAMAGGDYASGGSRH